MKISRAAKGIAVVLWVILGCWFAVKSRPLMREFVAKKFPVKPLDPQKAPQPEVDFIPMLLPVLRSWNFDMMSVFVHPRLLEQMSATELRLFFEGVGSRLGALKSVRLSDQWVQEPRPPFETSTLAACRLQVDFEKAASGEVYAEWIFEGGEWWIQRLDVTSPALDGFTEQALRARAEGRLKMFLSE